MNAETLTTYPTIREAFANGSGDMFYTKEGRYLAASDNIPTEEYTSKGFRWLTYEETLAIDATQPKPEPEPTPEPVRAPEPPKPSTPKSSRPAPRWQSERDFWIDEMPDGLGQYL